MKLSVATNFDPELIEAIKDYPVIELFGKLREDAVGGGRAPYQLSPVTQKRVADHVRHARQHGINFNYLLNASCMANREMTRKGQKAIDDLLEWVSSIGVTAVTVATPYMLRLVKTRYPKMRVKISIFGGIDRVRKAQMWEELGADCIVLADMLVNREFEVLRQIRKSVKCDLELIANNNCLMGCIFFPMHNDSLSHAGQSWHGNKGFFIDWCFFKCTEMKLRDPVNYLRSGWIRPEDLHIYEELGYDLFKITERDIPTSVMVGRVKAYAERRYEGNFLDLVQPYGFKGVKGDERYYRNFKGPGWFLRFVLRPGKLNILKWPLIKRLIDLRSMTQPIEGKVPVYIDNRALDGCIDRFHKEGCRDIDCEKCRWCHEFTEKAVSIDEINRTQALSAYDEVFKAMQDGSMWRYLPKR
jgi:collagenase-like PrtC family protease